MEPPVDSGMLEAELEELMRFNETLMRENELFESHLRRVAPQLLTGEDEPQGKSKRKSTVGAKRAVLAPEQKYEVASQEMEEVRDEIEATKGCGELALSPPRSTICRLPSMSSSP